MKNSCYRFIVVSFFLSSLVLLTPTSATGQVREWVDKTGKHKIKAEFKGVKDSKVILERTDGKRMTIPLSKLSVGDQAFVKTLVEPEKAPDTAIEKSMEPKEAEPPKPAKTESSKAEPAVEPEPKTQPKPPAPAPNKTEPPKSMEPAKAKPETPKIEKQPEPKPTPAAKPEPAPKTEPQPAPEKVETKRTPVTVPKPKPATPIKFSSADLEIPELGSIDQAQLRQLSAPFGEIAISINANEDISKVRRAMEALNDLASGETNPSLINLLKKSTSHEDETCRRHAIKQLARLEPSGALPFIARSLSDDSNRIRRHAFETIKESNDPRYIPALANRFPSVDRAQIFTILEQFGSQAELSVHPMLKHEKTKVRREAARLLGLIGTSASADVLRATDTDESGMVKLIAKKALKEIAKRGQ